MYRFYESTTNFWAITTQINGILEYHDIKITNKPCFNVYIKLYLFDILVGFGFRVNLQFIEEGKFYKKFFYAIKEPILYV
jgi:hypothetical protein